MDIDADRRVPRRVVTGHSPDGASVVLSDADAPVSKVIDEVGVTLHEVWSTSESPARITAAVDVDPTARELVIPPPVLGTNFRINEFQPGSLNAAGLQTPMHRTASIDYAIVLEGEIVLALGDSEVTLRAGDVVVQRGTDHAWANRSESVAKVAFVMVDAAFDPALMQAMPAGAVEGVADQ